MNDKYNNIEHLFQDAFSERSVQPSPEVLSGLKKKLWLKDFLSFKTNFFNIYYAATTVAGLGIFIGTTLHNPVDNTSTKTASGLSVQSTTVEEKTGTEITQHNIEAKPQEGEAAALPSAEFAASTVKGCAPLQVDFTNQSENAQQYTWDFGDGTVKSSLHAQHVYNKPGNYTARLVAKSANGKEVLQKKNITVFELPSAAFEIDQKQSSNIKASIQFVNQSEQAEKYTWLFGKGEISHDKNPKHTFSEYKAHTVKLLAYNANGCADTATSEITFLSEKYGISFPEVFVPNPSGPGNNGYFQSSSAPDNIFHPSYNGIQQYQLTITAPNGMEVFTTNNVLQGWNGYIRGSLMPAGQYRWTATGTFKDGETFKLQGQVQMQVKGLHDSYGY